MFESNLNKGKSNGYTPLDGNEKIPLKYLYNTTSSYATTGSNYFKGNQTVSGSIIANYFIGDGSDLTNVPNTGPISFNGSSIYTKIPQTSNINNNGSIFFGSGSGYNAYNANNSTFLGFNTGKNAYNSSYNTLIGYNVGNNVNYLSGSDGIGTNNIILGTNITLTNDTINSLNIGGVLFATNLYSDITTDPYSGSLGNGMVGVNNPNPTTNLDIIGTTFITGSLSVTNAPVSPSDVIRLQDVKYKGNWISNTPLNSYDNVYYGGFGNFIVNSNIDPSNNIISPYYAVQNVYGYNNGDSANLQSYLTWLSAVNNFTPLGDLFYYLEITISSSNNSTFPYFTVPRSVFSDNWIEFTITTDNNASLGFSKGYNSKYRFTPSLVPEDGLWYELLPYYQDYQYYIHQTGNPTVKLHIDAAYYGGSYQFRIRTQLISGSSGISLPIYTEFHKSLCKNVLFNSNNPTSYPVFASDYWSFINNNINPNTVLPNWSGYETGSVVKLGGTTQIGDNITDSTGSFFTKTISGNTGTFPIWSNNEVLGNSILSQSGNTINVSGSLSVKSTSETFVTIDNATGTVNNDFNSGDIFYYTSITSDFGVNFINTPTINNNTMGYTLVLNQGSTPYIVNSIEINGTSQTINWLGGSPPSGNANKIDVLGFSLIRTNSTWQVLGQLSTFG